MPTKRDITAEEEEEALLANMDRYNACNPSFAVPLEKWRAMLVEAKGEGYKSERCECGAVFLAFHHYTYCRQDGCPMSDGITQLERWQKSLEELDGNS